MRHRAGVRNQGQLSVFYLHLPASSCLEAELVRLASSTHKNALMKIDDKHITIPHNSLQIARSINSIIMCAMVIAKRDSSSLAEEVRTTMTAHEVVATRPMKRRRVSDFDSTRQVVIENVEVLPPSSATTSISPITTPPPVQQQVSAMKKTTTKKRRSVVSFASSVNVQTIPKWTSEESMASWYTTLDIHLFKLQEGTDAALLRCIIGNASSIGQLPQDCSHYRGLERLLSTQITNEIKERRKNIVKSVLVEQARQQSHGSIDVEQIAKVSRTFSDKAALWATTLGSLM